MSVLCQICAEWIGCAPIPLSEHRPTKEQSRDLYQSIISSATYTHRSSILYTVYNVRASCTVQGIHYTLQHITGGSTIPLCDCTGTEVLL